MQQKFFYVYKSSAGSGKTYTLVKEYLKIVLQNPQKIRNILAITFTNAAAAEMKERIIEALGNLSALAGKEESSWTSGSKNLLEILQKETPLQASEIIRRSQLALTLILHNYGDFSISTIDSFVHKVIRSFAFDLHLPLNFDVELDQDQLLTQAVDILVSRAGNEPALTRLLVEYIESRTDDEKSHYIEYDIAKMAKTLMDEKGTMYVERLKELNLEDFSKINQTLNREINEFENRVKQVAEKAVQIIENNGVDNNMFFQGKNGIGTWFRNLAGGQLAEKINPNTYVQKTIAEDKWTGGKAGPADIAAIASISPDLKNHYFQIEQISQQGLTLYSIHKLVKRNLFPMAVLCELEKVIDEIKTENSVLHISDFNKKISEIVSVESAPFIYERIGERYEHYMIDEFQDTSTLQWQNLLPLIDNSLASGHINLVVGDGKQAIYRWRNGDVEQFAMLPALPQSVQANAKSLWESTLERNYQELALDTNYRSRQEIVKFNNHFFEYLKKYLSTDLTEIYRGQEQKWLPAKTGGYVQLEFVEGIPSEEISVKDQTLLRILQITEELRLNGHQLNDITILCRSNSEASATARFLLENGLNVISSESLLLSQSPKVNFVLSVMKLLQNPEDEISMTEFLHYLIKTGKVSENLDEAWHQIKTGINNEKLNNTNLTILEKYLKDQNISFSFAACHHLGIYELGEHILRHFFKDKMVDPFLAFFMDVIYEYSNKYVSSPADFLVWWSENSDKYSVVVPEGVDAVQVMTIHKSKGLQFKVVIYPFADKEFSKPVKEGAWVDVNDVDAAQPLPVAWLSISSAMENTPYEPIWTEEKAKTFLDLANMVYVAFTRAADKLYVLSSYPGSGKFSDKCFSGLLQNYLAENNMWVDGKTVYEFGEHKADSQEIFNNEPRKPIPMHEGIFKYYISEPWSERISIRSKQSERKISDIHKSGSDRGSWLHEILAKIYCEDDIVPVLDRLLQTGETDKSEKAHLVKTIREIISNPILSPWFEKGLKVKNECGMYDSHGKLLRADRVVFQNESVVLIDYKTGNPHPEHAIQLNNYASVIKELGYTDIKKLLVYLDLNKVELV